jgi:multicomponent Na+:H+ antiporter subunit F
MMPFLTLEPTDYTMYVFTLLALAALFAFIRLVLGPTLADRVVAVEVIGAIVAAFIVVAAIHKGEGTFIDIALVFALVSFLGTLGFARFVLRGPRDV